MKDYLEDICGDESCLFDKQRELNLLSYTADMIKLGQLHPQKFDLIWTGKECLGFMKMGLCGTGRNITNISGSICK